MKIALTFSLLALATFTVQEDATAPFPDELAQHRWLQQLVGEWNASSELPHAGAEPTTWESRETVRSIGGIWIVAETTADDGGRPFTSLLTLGYDPDDEAFVGTWIDTMQTKLWTYVGHLDESERALTLEAEGPHHEDPGKRAHYRDRIEFLGPDRKRTTSTILEDDGTWRVYLTVEARRAK